MLNNPELQPGDLNPEQWEPPADKKTEPEERIDITLVYERGDGSFAQYETSNVQAWRFDYDAYSLLGSAFETYDGSGSCYFEASA